MSVQSTIRRKTSADIRARKNREPIVMLTSYHAHTAALVDRYCDVILVGDSLGNVMHGFETTVPVTMEMMILQGHAVMRGSQHSLVVVDMPFGSYEASKEQAFKSAARILKETHCGAVKLEGGARMAETIAFLVERGVPVMAHIGLTPQAVNTLGGYRVQGRGEDADRIRRDAVAVAGAGAFSVVLEKVPEVLAAEVTERLDIPTIGIGASARCDGQVLVVDDMLGLFTAFRPKFVKRYGELGAAADAAIAAYAEEVRARTFPAAEHVFGEEARK